MIIVKTPFRISFAGGGSDIGSFYTKNYGAVISATIDKSMYIMIHPYFHNRIRIKYSRTEDVNSIREIQHVLVRESLKLIGIGKGVEIASIADVPSGTGLGSSSAFTVGLLNALSAYQGIYRTKEWLARQACVIEIDKAKEPIGKQDQYAASFGGLNYIRFNPDEKVFVDPVVMKPAAKQRLEQNLLMFYVGSEREAGHILKEQTKAMKDQPKYEAVCRMVGIAEQMKKALADGKLDEFGDLLHQGWLLKRGLTGGITNARLDRLYKTALKAGALGGKILGAGGGGFFLFYCEPKYQDKLRQALKLRELEFRFENEGAKIVYFDQS